MPLRIDEVLPSEAPMDLLLLADPSENAIKKYLNQSRCFVAYDEDAVVAMSHSNKGFHYAALTDTG